MALQLSSSAESIRQRALALRQDPTLARLHADLVRSSPQILTDVEFWQSKQALSGLALIPDLEVQDQGGASFHTSIYSFKSMQTPTVTPAPIRAMVEIKAASMSTSIDVDEDEAKKPSASKPTFHLKNHVRKAILDSTPLVAKAYHELVTIPKQERMLYEQEQQERRQAREQRQEDEKEKEEQLEDGSEAVLSTQTKYSRRKPPVEPIEEKAFWTAYCHSPFFDPNIPWSSGGNLLAPYYNPSSSTGEQGGKKRRLKASEVHALSEQKRLEEEQLRQLEETFDEQNGKLKGRMAEEDKPIDQQEVDRLLDMLIQHDGQEQASYYQGKGDKKALELIRQRNRASMSELRDILLMQKRNPKKVNEADFVTVGDDDEMPELHLLSIQQSLVPVEEQRSVNKSVIDEEFFSLISTAQAANFRKEDDAIDTIGVEGELPLVTWKRYKQCTAFLEPPPPPLPSNWTPPELLAINSIDNTIHVRLEDLEYRAKRATFLLNFYWTRLRPKLMKVKVKDLASSVTRELFERIKQVLMTLDKSEQELQLLEQRHNLNLTKYFGGHWASRDVIKRELEEKQQQCL